MLSQLGEVILTHPLLNVSSTKLQDIQDALLIWGKARDLAANLGNLPCLGANLALLARLADWLPLVQPVSARETDGNVGLGGGVLVELVGSARAVGVFSGRHDNISICC